MSQATTLYPTNLAEEEIKARIKQDFFSLNPTHPELLEVFSMKDSKLDKDTKAILGALDCSAILGRIDFCVSFTSKTLFEPINFLWAEAKKGNKADIIESLIQLILTIGKERMQESYLPPLFLGAFDCEKIAFIPYHEVMSVFSQNDFNWNVTPSNHDSKEFKQLQGTLSALLDSKKLQFDLKNDAKELRAFILANFTLSNDQIHKIPISKNNFMSVYQKWLASVKDSIWIDWEAARKSNIIEADFFLADLLSIDNQSIKEKLFVVLEHNHYELMREKNSLGLFSGQRAEFRDEQKAHIAFWNLYERPPKEEYWEFIISRRDMLVPSDIRERKGSFFTPQIWVEKAQSYLEKALGEEWQEEYYIWDCAAGTGNLLANLNNPARIFASTLDVPDVDVMKELSRNASLPLLENHIFQFDFLNDSLDSHAPESKLPKKLRQILADENERKKLIIFINPPYAEAASTKTTTSTNNQNKTNVSNQTLISQRYMGDYDKSVRELFAQFFIRINEEIPHCILASFSTLKYVNASNFVKFREKFKAKFLKGFICPAYTFDNVKGNFPIGFLVWDLSQKE